MEFTQATIQPGYKKVETIEMVFLDKHFCDQFESMKNQLIHIEKLVGYKRVKDSICQTITAIENIQKEMVRVYEEGQKYWLK